MSKRKFVWVVEIDADSLEQAEKIMSTITLSVPEDADAAMEYFGELEPRA